MGTDALAVPLNHNSPRLICGFGFLTVDELLQEQKTDMDQFLSSISEAQPDITVSSEESVEVSVSEGKPYRPFQVTSLGSRSEPEGKAVPTGTGTVRCREHKPLRMI